MLIKAASDPINDLFEKWSYVQQQIVFNDLRVGPWVPLLTGGMNPKHARTGREYTMLFPLTIGSFWFLILIFIEVIPALSDGAYWFYLFRR